MSRYTLPDPKCRHKTLAVRVTAGHPTKTAHASRWVCARAACIKDAIEWATASTHRDVHVVKRGEYSLAEAEWAASEHITTEHPALDRRETA